MSVRHVHKIRSGLYKKNNAVSVRMGHITYKAYTSVVNVLTVKNTIKKHNNAKIVHKVLIVSQDNVLNALLMPLGATKPINVSALNLQNGIKIKMTVFNVLKVLFGMNKLWVVGSVIMELFGLNSKMFADNANKEPYMIKKTLPVWARNVKEMIKSSTNRLRSAKYGSVTLTLWETSISNRKKELWKTWKKISKIIKILTQLWDNVPNKHLTFLVLRRSVLLAIATRINISIYWNRSVFFAKTMTHRIKNVKLKLHDLTWISRISTGQFSLDMMFMIYLN